MSTICIFGDSITWGACDIEGGGWTGRLRVYLEKKHLYDIEVYNLGISGDTTDGLLKRFQTECAARQPQLIIISIGSNDSFYNYDKNNPQTPVKQFENNLIKLIKQAKKFTDKIVFVGLLKVDESKTAPIPWDTAKFYTNENILKYNSVVEKVCQKNNLIFIDVLNLLKNNEIEDGLHPNSSGHQKIFLKIKEKLDM